MIEWVLPHHRKKTAHFFSVSINYYQWSSVSIVHDLGQYCPQCLSVLSVISVRIFYNFSQYCLWSVSVLSMISVRIVHDLYQYYPWSLSVLSMKLVFISLWRATFLSTVILENKAAEDSEKVRGKCTDRIYEPLCRKQSSCEWSSPVGSSVLN